MIILGVTINNFYLSLLLIMKRLFLLLILSVLCVVSCKEYIMRKSISKAVLEFESYTIRIPSDVIVIDNGRVHTYSPNTRPKLLVVIDHEMCTECQISHLSLYENLFSLPGAEIDYDVMIIVEPDDNGPLEALSSIIKTRFPHPVLLDADRQFSSSNTISFGSFRFNVFMIDKNGKPVFVGNPTLTDAMMSSFTEAVSLLSSAQ